MPGQGPMHQKENLITSAMNSELELVVISRAIRLKTFRPLCCLLRLLHYYAFGYLLWTFSLGIPAGVVLMDDISQREL